MGGNWYTRANLGMFEVPKPLSSLGIGVDSIPQAIRNSKMLSGNDLGQLGNIEKLPNAEEIQQFIETEKLEEKIDLKSEAAKHEQAKKYINNGQIEAAWITLLA